MSGSSYLNEIKLGFSQGRPKEYEWLLCLMRLLLAYLRFWLCCANALIKVEKSTFFGVHILIDAMKK